MLGARILCVDQSNDGRGPFAQAYLELLRIWLANTSESRRWLFKDVSSAGLCVASEFTSKHHRLLPNNGKTLYYAKQDRTNLALSVFDRQGTFEGAEKRTIMARAANRKIRGIRASDFQMTFIICFDRSSYEIMKMLRQAASNDAYGKLMPAEIHLVEIASDLHRYNHELQAGKQMLRKWAAKTLGWKEPGLSLHSGFWGTSQVMVLEAGFEALLRDKEKRLAKIKYVTGCDVHFSSDREDGMRIVSIVGRKNQLELASMKVLSTW